MSIPARSEQSIEEEIAEAIKDNVHLSPWDTERDRMVSAIVTALSPLLNRVRAEALREAAKSLNENFQSIPAWTEAYREGVRTDEWMQGGVRMVMSAVDVLNARADRIEQNSEGNET